MNKHTVCALVALLLAASPGRGQISLGGQTSAHFYRSAHTQAQRELNGARPSFGLRADLFLTGQVTDNISTFWYARISGDGSIAFDYAVIRLTDLTSLNFNVEAGKFDVPFGNLGERRYPRRNPLYSLPLIYEYRTALPDQVPTEAEVHANRGQGTGMRLAYLGLYDLGAKVFGSFDIIDYAIAVTSGTISTTSYGGPNSNNDLAIVIRMAITPITGLTLGAAYNWGAYLDEAPPSLSHPVDVNAYKQRAAELDFEFSRGHAMVSGEVVYNTWPVPFDTGDRDLTVLGYFIEGKYTLIPRLYAAVRLNGLHFGDTRLGQVEQPWDYDVTEWEAGLGYFLDKDVLLKAIRRETRTLGGSHPKDNLNVLQLVVAF